MNKYEPGNQQGATIQNNFTYHPPFGDQAQRYEMIRDKAKELANMLITQTPPSREQALALTNLEQAIFWANASIARNESQDAGKKPDIHS